MALKQPISDNENYDGVWPENVRKSDVRIEYFRGSGKGGQNSPAKLVRV